MDLSFASNKLERQLSDAKSMQKAYGDRARRIQMRLDFLRSATCLADVPNTPPTRRHELDKDWVGHFAVDITGNWRLIFKPAHDPVPRMPDGGVDLAKVTAVEIAGIVDYHSK